MSAACVKPEDDGEPDSSGEAKRFAFRDGERRRDEVTQGQADAVS